LPATVEQLLALLDLSGDEVSGFIGDAPATTMQRMFGGQVLAQALVACARTVVEERHPHSLHAYFMRPGDPETPILYEVDRARDGRSFSLRRVVALQEGKAIFTMAASFHDVELGFEHQDSMPTVVPPRELPRFRDRIAGRADGVASDEWDALDIHYEVPSPHSGNLRIWFRTAGTLPDDPILHAAVLAYASDLTLLSAVLLHHDLKPGDPGLVGASLDHAMWFHRPARVDGWLLHDEESPSAFGGRGLARGRIFDSQGRLIASTAQEGVVRVRGTHRS